MCNRYFQFLTIGLIVIALAGCRGDSPVAPDDDNANGSVSTGKTASNHFLWGLWDVSIDPDTGEIESVPLRTADFNANVVRFLQPPISPIHMLTIALGPGCEPSTGHWVIDVTLKHPFPSMNMFRGFDVRGIIMTEGDAVGIHDTSVRYHATDGTRLLNADGYTRWWNMQEFTSYGKIFGYTEGARSTPGFNATATVNPYKLFTDALDLESLVNKMNADVRATFGVEPGINKRRYEMQFDIDGGTPPIRFKYAVDASWSLPDPAFAPDYPIQAYDLSANCQEPYLVEVPIFGELPYYENATTYGGDAVFLLTIGDWQSDSGENVIDQISHIWVESPTLIDAPIDVLPTMEFVESTHATQATYRVTVPDCHPTGLEDQYFLITVESAYPDSYIPQIQGDPYAFEWPDVKLAGYAVVGVPVSPTAPYMNVGWAKHAGGEGKDYGAYGITTLSDNSTVITGGIYNQALFGEGEPNETLLVPGGQYNAFVARYDAEGMLIWAKYIRAESGVASYAITSLSDNSIVIKGQYVHEAIFGEGEPNETVLHKDNGCGFIARYNPDGTLEWAKNVGTYTWFFEADGITSMTDDSVVIACSFLGTQVFGEGEPNETTLESNGSDVLIARYYSDGSLAWAKRAGGESDQSGNTVTVLSDDSVIIGGSYVGPITFGEGEPNETTLDVCTYWDMFIARYNTNGTVVWAKRTCGLGIVDPYSIAVFSNDSFAVGGCYYYTATFGEGEPHETTLNWGYGGDIFVAKYNKDGALQWAKSAGGEPAGNEICFGITSLTDDSMVITGYFSEMAVFGEGEANETILTSYGIGEVFLAKYNPGGTLAWATATKGSESTSYGSGYDISRLYENSTVICGVFRETLTFGVGEPYETTLESYGKDDIFIARYLP